MKVSSKTHPKIFIFLFAIVFLDLVFSTSVHSQDSNNSIWPDTMWIGKGGGFGVSNRDFPIPVEVHNIYDLWLIGLPLRIEEVSAFAILDSVEYIDRLASDTILDLRGDAIQWVDGISPDSFEFLAMTSSKTRCLPTGSGKLLNLWFTGDSTGLFTIDTCRTCSNCYLTFGECPWDFYFVPVFVSDTIEIRECGDVNQDDEVTISDAVYLVNYVFKSGPEPIPILLVGDVNEDNNIDVVDIVFIINYLFREDLAPCCL